MFVWSERNAQYSHTRHRCASDAIIYAIFIHVRVLLLFLDVGVEAAISDALLVSASSCAVDTSTTHVSSSLNTLVLVDLHSANHALRTLLVHLGTLALRLDVGNAHDPSAAGRAAVALLEPLLYAAIPAEDVTAGQLDDHLPVLKTLLADEAGGAIPGLHGGVDLAWKGIDDGLGDWAGGDVVVGVHRLSPLLILAAVLDVVVLCGCKR